jgi:hypothetical protein
MIPEHLINIYRYLLRYGWTVEQAIERSHELMRIFEYYGRDEATELLEKYKCQKMTV